MSLYSFQDNFCFIRVPRTGSTTIFRTIRSAYEIQLGDNYNIQWEDEDEGKHLIRTRWVHPSASEIIDIIGDSFYSLNSFGYIRNPWEWLISCWEFGHHHDQVTLDANTFEEFCKLKIRGPIDWLIDKDGKQLVTEIRRNEDIGDTLELGDGNLLKINESFNRGNWDRDKVHTYYTSDLKKYVEKKFYREIEIGKYRYDYE